MLTDARREVANASIVCRREAAAAGGDGGVDDLQMVSQDELLSIFSQSVDAESELNDLVEECLRELAFGGPRPDMARWADPDEGLDHVYDDDDDESEPAGMLTAAELREAQEKCRIALEATGFVSSSEVDNLMIQRTTLDAMRLSLRLCAAHSMDELTEDLDDEVRFTQFPLLEHSQVLREVNIDIEMLMLYQCGSCVKPIEVELKLAVEQLPSVLPFLPAAEQRAVLSCLKLWQWRSGKGSRLPVRKWLVSMGIGVSLMLGRG